MKIHFLALILICLLISNCSNDDQSEAGEVFTFEVDGRTVDLSNNIAYATIYNDSTELRIIAYNDDERMRLTIGEVTSERKVTEGLYTIGNSSGFAHDNIEYRAPGTTENGEPYSGIEFAADVLSNNIVGQINLTELSSNGRASGTFSGTLFKLKEDGSREYVTIENGVFKNMRISHSTIDIDPDIVEAKVDGINFVSTKVIASRRIFQGNDEIDIVAFDRDFGRITLILPSYVYPDFDYTFDYPDEGGVFFFNVLTRTPPETYGVSSINLITHDVDTNFIEGTFSVSGADNLIENGYFKTFYEDNVDDD